MDHIKEQLSVFRVKILDFVPDVSETIDPFLFQRLKITAIAFSIEKNK